MPPPVRVEVAERRQDQRRGRDRRLHGVLGDDRRDRDLDRERHDHPHRDRVLGRAGGSLQLEPHTGSASSRPASRAARSWPSPHVTTSAPAARRAPASASVPASSSAERPDSSGSVVTRIATTVGNRSARSADRARQRAGRPVRPPGRGDQHERLDAAELLVETGEQLGERGARRPHARQVAQELVRVGAAQHLGAVIGTGHQPRPVPLGGGRERHRRGGRARPVERRPLLAGVGRRVEHDREPARLLLLELTHHHGAGARRRGPVHVPHRVAGPVLTDPEVVGTLPSARQGVDRVRLGRGRPHERQRADREHGREHERLGAGGGHLPAAIGHAERRRGSQLDGRAPLRSPSRRTAARGDLRSLPRRQRGHQDPDRRQERVGRDQSEPHPAPTVRDAQPHDDLLALVDLGGRVALDPDVAHHPGGQHQTGHHGAQQQRGDHEEPTRLDVRPEEEQDGRADRHPDGPLAQARHGQPLPTARSGTGTSSSSRRTTSRAIAAPPRDCRDTSRCASAAGASAFTSSGST